MKITLWITFLLLGFTSCNMFVSNKLQKQITKAQKKIVEGDADYYVVRYGSWDTLRGEKLKIKLYSNDTYRSVTYNENKIPDKDIHLVKYKSGVIVFLHGKNDGISHIPNIPFDVRERNNEFILYQIRKGKLELYYADISYDSYYTRDQSGFQRKDYALGMFFFIRKNNGLYNEIFNNIELKEYIKDNKAALDVLNSKYNPEKKMKLKPEDLFKIIDVYNAS